MKICEISPEKPRSYTSWMVMSFFPGLRVRIKPTEVIVSEYDLICLVTPKWTFNCPPVTEYIHRLYASQNKAFAIFLVYGGHGEERYLRNLTKVLDKKGAHVVSTFAIRADEVRNGAYKDTIEKFHNLIANRMSPSSPIDANSSSNGYSVTDLLQHLIKNS